MLKKLPIILFGALLMNGCMTQKDKSIREEWIEFSAHLMDQDHDEMYEEEDTVVLEEQNDDALTK